MQNISKKGTHLRMKRSLFNKAELTKRVLGQKNRKERAKVIRTVMRTKKPKNANGRMRNIL